MSRRVTLLRAAAAALALFVLPRPASAAWPARAPLWATFRSAPPPPSQLHAAVLADGSGGMFRRLAGPASVDEHRHHAQRISAAGVPLWTANGVVVQQTPTTSELSRLTTDGAAASHRLGQPQRLDRHLRAAPDGSPRWPANGVSICSGRHPDPAGHQPDGTPRRRVHHVGRLPWWRRRTPMQHPLHRLRHVGDQRRRHLQRRRQPERTRGSSPAARVAKRRMDRQPAT